MANIHDISRDQWMLRGPLAKRGYDWWWHSMTAENKKTGEKKAFYVEFFTCNPALAEKEPVIVWNDKAKQKAGVRPSYLMVNAGFWGQEHGQLHRFFSLRDVKIHADAPYSVKADDCECSETHTKGSIKVTKEEVAAHPEWMSDAGEISWDFDIKKEIAFHVGYGANKFFRTINAFEMFWHAEGMKSVFSGTITLNGEKYILKPETCNGYSDKNWGGDFTSPWVWLSSNDLTSKRTGQKLKNSVFEIGGGRPKIFFLALNRKLLGEFYYEGKDYDFNFAKFWTLSRTKFDCRETPDEIHWHVVQITRNAKLETKIRCKKSEMLNIRYEAPTGLKRHNRLWNGGTGEGVLKLYKRSLFGFKEKLIDEVYARGVGCEYGEYGDD
ncbi:MAG: hypothetical protein IJI01_06800 [Butyrivibrio sp.]|uniref:tocopherol cyclase family protein n=1 Tax=Butyrivibrio sp. TaxID=28121 RepID=UPI0025B80DEF|nr:tocopherol cyclase family protein [Butyrivibrio sp.]MBQ6588366.1 hypothetical protein [Butyrivibrio sp.]